MTMLCLQLTIVCLCLTGPAFNTQLGILFWSTTGALFGAVTASDRDEAIDVPHYA